MGEVTPPARCSRDAETYYTDGTPRLALVAMGRGLARTVIRRRARFAPPLGTHVRDCVNSDGARVLRTAPAFLL
jgi:hypothetical protein